MRQSRFASILATPRALLVTAAQRNLVAGPGTATLESQMHCPQRNAPDWRPTYSCRLVEWRGLSSQCLLVFPGHYFVIPMWHTVMPAGPLNSKPEI